MCSLGEFLVTRSSFQSQVALNDDISFGGTFVTFFSSLGDLSVTGLFSLFFPLQANIGADCFET